MNDTAIGRLRRAIAGVMAVLVVGTIGYLLFGLSFTDAVYQTVTTVSTVGFRELHDFSTLEQWFTIGIIILGASTVLYTFTLSVQVVVDVDADRIADLPYPTVVGDATLDSTLRTAGLERARSLIAALEGDAENLFVTLSARAIVPDLFIVARARQDESVPKLANAGADRVVNPQELGAARMASFVARPHVAEFIDVVMHERSLEFRMQEIEVTDGSPLAGKTLREVNLRKLTGVLVLAVRLTDGTFTTNPDPGMIIEHKQVLIAVGTDDDLHALVELTDA